MAAAACSSGGGGDDGLGAGDDFSVAAALSELPAALGDEPFMISAGDLTVASDIAGLERPTTPDRADVAPWIFALTDGPTDNDDESSPVFVPIADMLHGGGATDPAEFADALGWSVVEVERFVELSSPPSALSVVTGDFGDDALGGDVLDLGDGVLSLGDGEDFETNLEEPGAVDRLGRSVRLGRDGDRIALGFATDVVKDWVAGDGGSLADDESLRAVAEALDDENLDGGLYAAVIHRSENGFGIDQSGLNVTASVIERIEDDLPPEPFDTVGIGWGVEDGEPTVILVFSHADREAAEANVNAFAEMLNSADSIQSRRLLQELYDPESVRSKGQGLLIIRLTPGPSGRPGTVFESLIRRDLPFAHA